RFLEGSLHGLLDLRTDSADHLAVGDLLQDTKDGVVTSRLVFAFKDGSVHDETAVFTQHREFRLTSYTLAQKGPAFPMPVDVTIDAKRGRVSVRYSDDKGETKTEEERIDLPSDLANGIVPIVLKNGRPDLPPSMSMVVATPKPRLVKLVAT